MDEMIRVLRKSLEENLDAEKDHWIPKLKKRIDDTFAESVGYVESYVLDDVASHLTSHVQRCAEKAIDALLKGDEPLFRRYLSATPNGYTGRDRDHSVIHGRLFECQAMEIRRRIVDAYPELLKNERILDLEDQVRSLTDTVANLQNRLYGETR